MLWHQSFAFEMRARKVAAFSAFAYVACGGQTDSSVTALDTGGSMSRSNTGGVANAGTTELPTLGGTFDVARGGSGGIPSDAGTTCQMPLYDIDSSCTTDADCTAVPGGDPCVPNSCGCAVGMNIRVAERYIVDYEALSALYGQPPGVCSCPCMGAICCRQGQCRNGCGDCN